MINPRFFAAASSFDHFEPKSRVLPFSVDHGERPDVFLLKPRDFIIIVGPTPQIPG